MWKIAPLFYPYTKTVGVSKLQGAEMSLSLSATEKTRRHSTEKIK